MKTENFYFKLVVKNKTGSESIRLNYDDACRIYSKKILDEDLDLLAGENSPKGLFSEMEFFLTPTMSLFVVSKL